METTYKLEVFSGNAPDPDPGPDPFAAHTPAMTYFFSNATKILYIWSLNNDLLIRLSYTSVPLNWNDPIRIFDAPQSQDLIHSTQAFQIANVTAGAVAWYQVVGTW